MHIEHFVFLSCFPASPESHEQDGEKLSRVTALAGSNSVWRSCHGVSNLALPQEAILIGSCQIAGRAYRRRLNERTRSRVALRNALGSKAPRETNHRRIPSFSIKLL